MEREDSYRHKGLRKQLVQQIQEKGIRESRVLEAMGRVPRHLYFFDSAFVERAYEDTAFPIGEGQTISQPYTVAYQTQLLEVKAGDKILEVGTGSGYQASVLAELGAKVFTIERQRKLFDKAKTVLQNLNYSGVKIFYGDGYEGLPMFAPFNKILITAAAPEIPAKLLDQLRVGGFLVVPVGENVQQMKRFIKLNEENKMHEEVYDQFIFVPMLKGKVK
jgi:protein-L-isoaspartate(D-aspartate) O-methyltransferase